MEKLLKSLLGKVSPLVSYGDHRQLGNRMFHVKHISSREQQLAIKKREDPLDPLTSPTGLYGTHGGLVLYEIRVQRGQ